MAKNAIAKIKTPKGTLEWVVIDGDGKENLSGRMKYNASVRLPADSAIFESIEKFWADNKPAKYKKDAKSLGIYPAKVDSGDVDEDGKAIFVEDPDSKVLAFSTDTTYQSGDPKVIQVWNSKARKVKLPDGVKIGNGSVGSIAGAMGIYTNESKGGAIIDAGVTLYLDAVQVFKLEEFSSDPGFDADESDEDGWDGEDDGMGDYEEPKADGKAPAKTRL